MFYFPSIFSFNLSLLTCSNLYFPCLLIRNCIKLAAELVTESALVLNCTLLSRNLCSCWLSVGFVRWLSIKAVCLCLCYEEREPVLAGVSSLLLHFAGLACLTSAG
jgi:hypothetical protein